MEITEKNRYMCRVQTLVNGKPEIQTPWVEECNLLRDAYDKIQSKYGFRNDLVTEEDFNTKAGVRGVRLLNGDLI